MEEEEEEEEEEELEEEEEEGRVFNLFWASERIQSERKEERERERIALRGFEERKGLEARMDIDSPCIPPREEGGEEEEEEEEDEY